MSTVPLPDLKPFCDLGIMLGQIFSVNLRVVTLFQQMPGG